MNTYGFQKMTLLDFPGRVACTVFTGGCNLRCPFCHNALLVTELDDCEAYPEDEILSFLKKRQGILEGVAITGGEPLIQSDIEEFIKKVRDLGFAVKLDTNGTLPDKLMRIVNQGLVDYVAIDVKNSKEKYAMTAGVNHLNIGKIEQSIKFLMESGVDYEFRTTVVKEFHTVEDIRSISEWIKGSKRYFLQNFVDSGELIGSNMSAVTKETLEEMRLACLDNIPQTEIRGI